MNNLLKFTIFSILIALTAPRTSIAIDVSGSSDHPNVKRYENSEIVAFSNKAFDQYTLPLGKAGKVDFNNYTVSFENSKKLEGRVIRITYTAPVGRSALEVFRNYQDDLKNNNFNILFAGSKNELGNTFNYNYFDVNKTNQLLMYSPANQNFLAAESAEGDIAIGLYITEFEGGASTVKVQKNQVLIQLDIVEQKKMEQKMVVIKSSEIAEAINKNGRIALYGILFDFNQTTIKPESEESIKEIASFLNENPTIKVSLVGHTDNVGGLESNMKLSEGRAKAVLEYLSTKYSIDKNRLFAAGVGYLSPVATNKTEEGRSKNRRVEIVE